MFKLGDLVQLKSGSPIMTVSGIGDGEIVCIWFDSQQARKQEIFITEVLVPYKEVDLSY